MSIAQRLRFSMATVMMLVVAAAAGSAVFAKFHELFTSGGIAFRGKSREIDYPATIVLATALAATAIGAARRHGTLRTFLLASVTYLMLLALAQTIDQATIWKLRALRYWLQGCFAITVVAPLLAIRAFGLGDVGESPRQRWLRLTLESLIASFLNLVLVGVGVAFQMFLLEVI